MSETNHVVLAGAPLGMFDARLAAAVARAGAVGLMDVVRPRDIETLERLVRRAAGPLGARVLGAEASARLAESDVELSIVVTPVGVPAPRRAVVAEVTNLPDAQRAVLDGAIGLLARGVECGDRGGAESAFILVQRILDADLGVPVWAAGGIGPHSAAAAIAGGAHGVLLDTQLALFPESPLSSADRDHVRRAANNATGQGGPTPAMQAGQDLLLALDLSARYQHADELLAAVVRRVEHLVTDVETAVTTLAAGSPAARALGVRLPLVQGPMTRVSDVPAFARAVADAGALPTIALAMMTGDQVDDVARGTAQLLGERPWGVGLLGFLPDEVRREQVAALGPSDPSVAILAGGRPAQAAELAATGVPSFLHVPSPVLLAQFLRQGASRFIFEGAECGGHIGPTYGFALWEMQTAVLLQHLLDRSTHDATENLLVLYAGGISTARSAAMIAAMTAPLAAAGVGVGMLVGTAYALTREAVECGAVTDGFQGHLLGADRTCVLQTAPGHASRCAPSPYVDEFARVREQLEHEGVGQREIGARLEQLNVGRLRIATKGLERDGARTVAVSADRREAEGMFMAGQVVALHDEPATLAELHDRLTVEAADHLRRRAEELRPVPASAETPRSGESGSIEIAVVGMACMFAGSPDLETYWSTVLDGRDAIGPVPPERWNRRIYHDDPLEGVPAVDAVVGGFLAPTQVDPVAFGIPPASFGHVDPAHILALEVSYRALDDAGLAHVNPHRDRTAVIFGAESGCDLASALSLRTHLPSMYGHLPAGVADRLPTMTSDTFPGMLSNVIAGRVANRLDLGGANFVVDAACASSLAALSLACDSLRQGASDVALAGGVDLHNAVGDYVMFSSLSALSRSGTCRPFDRAADGIVLGEGVVCVVLKRREDAERDGDRIYCVVEAIGSSSDGRAQGLTAPRPSGQVSAMRRALHRAGVDPEQVELVEAHGTGTAVGDRSELTATASVYAPVAGRTRTLGSVKAQIGHTKCAAGLAGFVKAALALHSGVLPPTMRIDEPLDADLASGFAFRAEPAPWLADRTRRAAVSAFGFGGTNFHAIAREHERQVPPARTRRSGGAELVLVRGTDPRSAATAALTAIDTCHGGPHLGTVVRALDSLATGRPVQVSMVARDVAALRGALALVAEGTTPAPPTFIRTGRSAPVVAVLFPGQGSQRTGMLGQLLAEFPDVVKELDVDAELAAVIHPGRAFGDETVRDQRATLTRTENAQPALGVTSLLAYRLLERAGVRADMLAGHSYGEVVALVAAGAIPASELIRVSRARATSILGALGDDPGSMLAVTSDPDTVARLTTELGEAGLVVANDNAPRQQVLSGPTSAIVRAEALCRTRGLSTRRLPVACAFHSPALGAAVGRFREQLENLTSAPDVPVWSNTTGGPYGTDADSVADTLADAVARPVGFREQVLAMWDAGARLFVEAGPGGVLTTLVQRILGDRDHVAVGFEDGHDGVDGYLLLLARLAAEGVDVDTRHLERPVPVPVAHSPAVHLVDGGGARPTGMPPLSLWPADGAELVEPAGTRDTPTATTGTPRAIAPPHPYADVELVEEDLVTTHASLPTPVQTAPSLAAEPERTVRPASLAGDRGRRSPSDLDLVGQFVEATTAMQQSLERVVIASLAGREPAHAVPPAAVRAAEKALAALDRTPIVRPSVSLLEGPAPGRGTAAGSTTRVAAPEDVPPEAQTRALAHLDPPVPVVGLDVQLLVQEVIADRTGYPVAMVEPTLDLESDLSIDSIKRLEIAGELVERAGLDVEDLGADAVEELSKARTVTTIVHWLDARAGTTAPARPAAPELLAPEALPGAHAPMVGLDVQLLVQEVIADRTGYPVAMVEPTLDLESDLSIDSIKRLEIAGELVERAGLDVEDLGADAVEELSKARTVTTIVHWLDARGGTTAPARPAAPALLPGSAPDTGGAPADPPQGRATGDRPVRYVPVQLALPEIGRPGTPTSVLLLADAGHADGVALLLTEAGGAVTSRPLNHIVDDESAHSIVYVVDDARCDRPVLPALYEPLKAALSSTATRRVLIVVRRRAADAEPMTAGLGGFVRTAAKEFPEVDLRLVVVDPDVPPGEIPAIVHAELDAVESPAVVTRTSVERRSDLLDERALADDASLSLAPGDVVVLYGGARGITSHVALAIARRTGAHLALVGSTPVPPATDPYPGATGLRALRAAVVTTEGLSVRDAELRVRLLSAQREIRETLGLLAAAGATAEYASVDVRDSAQVEAHLRGLHEHHGRASLVVFGSGVNLDQLIARTSQSAFTKVFDTKAVGMRSVLRGLDAAGEAPDAVVAFGSIAAVDGSRGQIGYTAGNDAMEQVLAAWGTARGVRALTVNWGPWAPRGERPGMVSPELERDFLRRGKQLLDPDQAADCLLGEIAHRSDSPSSVVWAAAGWVSTVQDAAETARA